MNKRERIDNLMSSDACSNFTTGDWLDFAYRCLDQADVTEKDMQKIRNIVLMSYVDYKSDDMHETLNESETEQLLEELRRDGIDVRIVEQIPPETED